MDLVDLEILLVLKILVVLEALVNLVDLKQLDDTVITTIIKSYFERQYIASHP